MRRFGFLFIVTLAFSPGTSWGWGDLGHQVVGEVADRLLTEKTRAKVYALLAKSGMSLAEAGVWMDHMKSNADFKNTALGAWHYVNFDQKTGAPQGDVHAIWAVEQLEKILSGQAPAYEVPRRNPKVGQAVIVDKSVALLMLVHLVADLHQPLHCGFQKDRGGNECLVKWFGEVQRGDTFWNLHSIWDDALIKSFESGRLDLANDLIRRLDNEKREKYAAAKTPMEWAQESASMLFEVYPQLDAKKPVTALEQPYCNNPKYKDLNDSNGGAGIDGVKRQDWANRLLADPQIPRLGFDYRFRQAERTKQQMAKAGVRLAALLERALGNPRP